MPYSPKILILAELLGLSRREALGLAVEWFCWLDGITADGNIGLSAELVDKNFFNDILSQKNVTHVTETCDTCHKSVTSVSQALSQIGWLHMDENGKIYAVDFEKHNGETAKKRAEAAERQRKSRARKQSQKNVTSVTKKCDQIREDKNIYSIKNPNGSITPLCGGATVNTSPSNIPLPATADEVQAFMAAQAVCGLKGDELATCAQAFFNDSEAVGWTLKGQPVRDWRAAARAFLARWQQNKHSNTKTDPVFTFRSATKQNYDL